jgi:hypothetical protein
MRVFISTKSFKLCSDSVAAELAVHHPSLPLGLLQGVFIGFSIFDNQF